MPAENKTAMMIAGIKVTALAVIIGAMGVAFCIAVVGPVAIAQLPMTVAAVDIILPAAAAIWIIAAAAEFGIMRGANALMRRLTIIAVVLVVIGWVGALIALALFAPGDIVAGSAALSAAATVKPFSFGGYTAMMNRGVYHDYARRQKRIELREVGEHFALRVTSKKCRSGGNLWRIYEKVSGREVGIVVHRWLPNVWEAITSSVFSFMGDKLGEGKSFTDAVNIVAQAAQKQTDGANVAQSIGAAAVNPGQKCSPKDRTPKQARRDARRITIDLGGFYRKEPHNIADAVAALADEATKAGGMLGDYRPFHRGKVSLSKPRKGGGQTYLGLVKYHTDLGAESVMRALIEARELLAKRTAAFADDLAKEEQAIAKGKAWGNTPLEYGKSTQGKNKTGGKVAQSTGAMAVNPGESCGGRDRTAKQQRRDARRQFEPADFPSHEIDNTEGLTMTLWDIPGDGAGDIVRYHSPRECPKHYIVLDGALFVSKHRKFHRAVMAAQSIGAAAVNPGQRCAPKDRTAKQARRDARRAIMCGGNKIGFAVPYTNGKTDAAGNLVVVKYRAMCYGREEKSDKIAPLFCGFYYRLADCERAATDMKNKGLAWLNSALNTAEKLRMRGGVGWENAYEWQYPIDAAEPQ